MVYYQQHTSNLIIFCSTRHPSCIYKPLFPFSILHYKYIVAIFFGIIFGAFSLGIAAPNFKSITKGRQAARCVLDVIQREPEIKLDNPNSVVLSDFKGEVELKNVSFTYKT